MSFKIGDRVREIATGDEGTITSFNDLTISVYWTKGQDIGRHLATFYSDVVPIPHVTFSQSDLQILENELKKQINLEYCLARQYKHYAKRLWEVCDKNDRETEKMFESFSDARKNYKYRKAKLNQLAALQAKIKPRSSALRTQCSEIV